MIIDEKQQRQLDGAGEQCAWQSLNPFRDDPAQRFIETCGLSSYVEADLSRFYYFLQGWRRKANIFKDSWIGKKPEDRRV